MSWPTGSLLWTRERFVLAALAKQKPFAQVCHEFQITRPTGYKWLRRFRRAGRDGLRDRSRRPHHSPQQLAPRWWLALRQLRRCHPTWGPRKLRARLRQLHPRVRLPAARTLGRWLHRLQLVPRKPRHQRRGPQLPPRTRTVPARPNDVWTIDFKGWYRTGDGTRVEPLTVRDLKSRFLLDIRLLPNQSEVHVHRALLRVFRHYGLPKAIWVDNGPPFGGVGPLGYSRLAVWWRRLGIRVEYGRPAHPQDNAAHEQMHGVYQIEVAAHPAIHPPAGQRQSNHWRNIYNQVRPHEALNGRTPAQLYRPSPRKLPRNLPDWSYPSHWHQKRVSADGRLFWQGRQRFIGRAFGGEKIGLQLRPSGIWNVYLGSELLGTLHQQDRSRSLRPTHHARH
jgi:putative transposase